MNSLHLIHSLVELLSWTAAICKRVPSNVEDEMPLLASPPHQTLAMKRSVTTTLPEGELLLLIVPAHTAIPMDTA